MKVEKHDGTLDRKLLIGLVTNKELLAGVTDKWGEEGLFDSTWENLVGRWCVRYYEKYEKAPLKNVENLFHTWASSRKRNRETVKLVESFLQGLSEEYARSKKANTRYLMDLAGQRFSDIAMLKLSDKLKSLVERGERDKAKVLLSSFDAPEIGMGSGIDVMNDTEAMRRAFEIERDPLIVYPGGMGKLVGDAFARDSFVSWIGGEKRGKSWQLLDAAVRGVLQRRKVAYFQAGDLSEDQIIRRLMVRFAKKPEKPRKLVLFPKSIKLDEDGDPQVVYEERSYPKALEWRQAWRACQDILKWQARSRSKLLNLSVHPNSSLTMNQMRGTLRGWSREGFDADIVIVDYADLIRPSGRYRDKRDQIDEVWSDLRSLSQTYHCLVLTATQTNAAAYKAHTVTRSNFSENKRIMAHVSGMLGISVTDEEKQRHLIRQNWVQLRGEDFVELACCHVAQCLALAQPNVCSVF
jgi:hypothetical protein